MHHMCEFLLRTAFRLFSSVIIFFLWTCDRQMLTKQERESQTECQTCQPQRRRQQQLFSDWALAQEVKVARMPPESRIYYSILLFHFHNINKIYKNGINIMEKKIYQSYAATKRGKINLTNTKLYQSYIYANSYKNITFPKKIFWKKMAVQFFS